VTARARRTILRFAREVADRRRGSRLDASSYDGDGRLAAAKGALWNATDQEGQARILDGYTKAEVRELIGALRRLGHFARFEEADGLLSRALREGLPDATMAARKAAHRAREVAAGRCRETCGRPARPKRKTCQECSDAAAARARRRRPESIGAESMPDDSIFV
jgi:hypothetical protein